MYDDEGDQDPVSNALRSRRIPHGRSGKNTRSGKASGRSSFDPLRAVGVYEVKVGSTKSKRHQDETDARPASNLTIHSLSPDETGLIASFDINGALIGMCVLAGSRRGVKKIVAELEKGESEEESEGEADDESATVADDDEDDEEVDTAEMKPRSAMEEEDDRINRRAKAFEKNSFRNPKFWMHWRAHVKGTDNTQVNESNVGYIVFSGNDCTTFDGTISSEVLGWDNMRIKAHKVKSHAGACPVEWTDFDE